MLIISGTAKAQSAVIFSFKDGNVLETKQVVIADSAGKWTYEKTVSSDTLVGLKSLVIENDQTSILKNLTITSAFVLQMTSLTLDDQNEKLEKMKKIPQTFI